MAENEHDWWREESITAYPNEEDPISVDSKKTLSLRTLTRILSMRNLKRTLVTVKPKDNVINGDPEELQDPQCLLRRRLTLFGFLVMVYHRVDEAINFQRKILVLEGFVFMLPVTKGPIRTRPGIINCFSLHRLFTGGVSSISNKCDQCVLW